MIKVLKSVVVGPLEPYAAGFATELERQGYTAGTAEKQVALAAHLSRWLAAAGPAPATLRCGQRSGMRQLAGLLAMRATSRRTRWSRCLATCAGWAWCPRRSLSR